ncbi:hypothetical protein [Streptomyces sp. cmx-4-7]
MNLPAVLPRQLNAVLVVPGGLTMMQGDEGRDLLPAALRDEWPVVVTAPA